MGHRIISHVCITAYALIVHISANFADRQWLVPIASITSQLRPKDFQQALNLVMQCACNQKSCKVTWRALEALGITAQTFMQVCKTTTELEPQINKTKQVKSQNARIPTWVLNYTILKTNFTQLKKLDSEERLHILLLEH